MKESIYSHVWALVCFANMTKRKRASERLDAMEPSPMGLMMLRDFAEGKMPASKLQEYAHAAVKSGVLFECVYFSFGCRHMH